MQEESYEFDPCQFDDDEGVSIDNWKPSAGKSNNIVKSQWRQQQNAGRYDLEPGIDDLHKIQMRLKKKFPDSQIMDEFGISAETLVAIKRDKYCPIDGISLDNISKVYKEFAKMNAKIDRKIEKVFKVFEFMDKNMFSKKDKEKHEEFKSLIKNKKLKKEVVVEDEDE